MNNSIFWARLLGLYIVIVCLGMFEGINAYESLIEEMTHNEYINIILGLFALLLGLTIVVNHSVWRGWPILITVLGYWIVMKGILLLYFPEYIIKFITVLHTKNLYLGLLPSLAFGFILLYCGFLHHRKGME